jgi:hypothetical protein
MIHVELRAGTQADIRLDALIRRQLMASCGSYVTDHTRSSW